MIKLSKIKTNPKNPRIIKDDKFRKLCNSIKDFPKMMELRPIVVDADGVVLGGNMRLKALKELGYKEIPDGWVKKADDLTKDEQRRFIIEDNVGFGEWDWADLTSEWDVETLEAWGLDSPFDAQAGEKTEKQTKELRPFKMAHILISYDIDAHDDVISAIEQLLADDRIEIEKGANG